MIIKSRKTEEMAAEDIPCPCDVSSVLCTTGTNLPSRYSKVKVMVVSGAITPSKRQHKSEIEVCFNMVHFFSTHGFYLLIISRKLLLLRWSSLTTVYIPGHDQFRVRHLFMGAESPRPRRSFRGCVRFFNSLR